MRISFRGRDPFTDGAEPDPGKEESIKSQNVTPNRSPLDSNKNGFSLRAWLCRLKGVGSHVGRHTQARWRASPGRPVPSRSSARPCPGSLLPAASLAPTQPLPRGSPGSGHFHHRRFSVSPAVFLRGPPGAAAGGRLANTILNWDPHPSFAPSHHSASSAGAPGALCTPSASPERAAWAGSLPSFLGKESHVFQDFQQVLRKELFFSVSRLCLHPISGAHLSGVCSPLVSKKKEMQATRATWKACVPGTREFTNSVRGCCPAPSPAPRGYSISGQR